MNLFLDACTLIYWVEAAEPYYSRLLRELRKMEKGASEVNLVISRLSTLECRVKPLKERNENKLHLYEDLFENSGAVIVELTPEVIDFATHLRARYPIKTPDAIQAASALMWDEEVIFLTQDRGFNAIPHLHLHYF